MPFKKGHKKIGGRKAGTPNKASTEIRQILEKKGIDLVEELVALANRTKLEEYTGGVAARIFLGLLDKAFPTPKSIEITNSNNFIPIVVKVDGKRYEFDQEAHLPEPEAE